MRYWYKDYEDDFYLVVYIGRFILDFGFLNKEAGILPWPKVSLRR